MAGRRASTTENCPLQYVSPRYAGPHEREITSWVPGNSRYKNKPNCLVYAAKVGRRLEGQEYYSKASEQRPDCIYKFINGEFKWRSGAKFHGPEQLAHDLGKPPYCRSAKVLLVENPEHFGYFRDSCPIDYRTKYRLLGSFIRGMTQGHRINMAENILGDVRSLLSEVWRTPQTLKNSCVPSTLSPTKCSDDEGHTVCDC